MGNCFGSQLAADPNPSSSNINTSTSGTSRNNSNGGGHSATSSSAQFSRALSDDTSFNNGEILPTPNIKEYSFADLKNATRNFKGDMVLGVGGFGTVYKGWVDEKTLLPSKIGTGIMVAIKKLNPESTQGFDEWQTEVDFLGKLSHPNLVKLLGYCWEDKELLLVYEFMQKGSLENHLFRRMDVSNGRLERNNSRFSKYGLFFRILFYLFKFYAGHAATEALPWHIRLRIAIGAAKGLAFLHTSERQVIYRDFKASNILLDGSYNAKISDFGLAKLGPSGGDSHVTTRIMGTHGYAAPEYIATGHLYVKSDVYGFGVVLLEIMTGQRAHDSRRPNGQQNLVEWVKPILSKKRKLKTIMDARLEGRYSSNAAQQAAQLTLRCLEPEPRKRPPMSEVVEVLQQIAAIDKPKESKNNSSTHSSSSTHRHSPRYHRSPGHPNNRAPTPGR